MGNREPYVILCSGQSNMARITPDIHWNPPSNLLVWRYSAHKHGSGVGDGFATPASDIGNYANFYGAEVARRHPDRDVYILNISKGGTNLCQWFESAKPINMWTAIVDNVAEAFLHISGKTHIDEIIWWGHESDAAETADISATQFRDDFLEVIKQIDSQEWVSANKPLVRLHKIHPLCNGLAAQINFGLELIVQHNLERFLLSDTTKLNYSDNIHLDPDQKEEAARQVLTAPPMTLVDLRRPKQSNLLQNSEFLSNNRSTQQQFSETEQVAHDHWFANKPNTQYEVVDQIVHLAPNSAVAQKLPSSIVSGQVVTISMRNTATDLKVQVDNQNATVTAGEGRRQASFRLPKTCEQYIVVSIATFDGVAGSFSDIKLEPGGAYT